MSLWTIEPRDRLVVRDARSQAGTNRLKSLPFPLPTTVAGCVRTRIGSARQDWIDVAQQVTLVGPWLVDLGRDHQPLAPAPRDCFWVGGPGKGRTHEWHQHHLVPQSPPAGSSSNLPPGLAFVLPKQPPEEQSKGKNGPRHWQWSAMLRWLAAPSTGQVPEASLPGPLEVLTSEERTHVSIDPDTHTAREGALYSTEGLRFGASMRDRYALGFRVDGNRTRELSPGMVRLGGEGRLSRLELAPESIWPQPDPALSGALASHSGRIRIVLLTPGLFPTEGWRPSDAALQRVFGQGARLVAACVDRPLTVSGWEVLFHPDRKNERGYREEWGPKASRRAVPAGAVYWVETTLRGEELLNKAWMQSLYEEDQDHRDGFGRMLLGVG